VRAAVFLREIATDGHFILSNTEYPLVFEYAGMDVKTVYLSANNGKPIINDLLRRRIEGLKLTEDGEGLGGAVIGLFGPDETEFAQDTALLTTISAEDGSFAFEDIPAGDWLVREIAAPEAFVLSEEAFPVTIAEQGQIIRVELENRYIRGSVRTVKVDAEYPENKLSGAVFDVYADTHGNGIFDDGIDILAGTLDEIEQGIYQLDRLLWGGYFLHERTAPALFVKDESYHYFEIREDGETVTVENAAGGGFINKPITGELWLTKKDVSDGKLIPNCGIRIRDEYGNTVIEGRTDENGEVRFTLRAGKYTYSEFDCEGYKIDTAEYPFEITEDGQIIKAVMTNEKLPKPDIPKTGDNSNPTLYLAIMGVSAAALIGLTVGGKRSKRRNAR
jgi:LPXTG-motif cell wall-anchored protein